MTLAEELLATTSEIVAEHTHPVTDPDSYFVIDPDTRRMENASRSENVVMQFDHDSEIYTFQLPRYVEGHDMMLCNRVRVHFNNIDGQTGEEVADVAEMTDLQINPENSETVISTWSIKRQATQKVGILSFLVQYECIENGESVYEWHTDIYDGVQVKKGRNNSEAAVIEYSNILEQWYQRIFGTGDAVLANIEEAGNTQIEEIRNESATQQAEIVAKGEETLKTIPDDYTKVYQMAEEALRTKADAIAVNVEGEHISVTDASDDYLLDMRIFGRTTQRTTTGEQLIRTTLSGEMTVSGLTFTPTDDGNLNVRGTHTEGAMWLEFGRASLVAGKTYTLSSADGFSIHLWDLTNNKEYRTKKLDTPYLVIEPTESIDCALVLNDAVLNKAYSNIKLNAILNEGDSAVVWEPYTGGKAAPNTEYPQELVSVGSSNNEISVDITSRNLFDQNGTVTSKYSTYELNAVLDHGVVSISGTSMLGYGTLKTSLPLGVFKKGETYRISRVGKNFHSGFWFYDENDINLGSLTTENSLPITIPENADHMSFFYAGVTPETEVNITEKFMLNLGTEALPWEPSIETRSIVHKSPNGLSGIPVSDGGTYTDSSGQQYVADEVVYDYTNNRWQYIQRIGETIYDGTEYWSIFSEPLGGVNQFFIQSTVHYHDADSPRVMSNSFIPNYINNRRNNYGTVYTSTSAIAFNTLEYTTIDEWKALLAERFAAGNPVTVQYILAEPIVTELTTEEVMAFKALRTNKPNTVIQNGDRTHMAVTYAADTLVFLRDHQPKPTDEQVINAVYKYAEANEIQVPSDEYINALIDAAIGGIVNDEY